MIKAEFENDGKFDWHYAPGEKPKETYIENLSRRKRVPLAQTQVQVPNPVTTDEVKNEEPKTPQKNSGKQNMAVNEHILGSKNKKLSFRSP